MAPKKRGLSLEDKRCVILNIFQESKSVFVLKVRLFCELFDEDFMLMTFEPFSQDIEKLASKRGVVSQSVKEVLQSLVDDDLVNQDKIGISNFFWSFTSAASVRLDRERTMLLAKLTRLQEEEDEARANIAKEMPDKEDCQEREVLCKKIEQLNESIQTKKRDLESYSTNDPTRFESLKKMKITSKDGANRWTDNIFALQGWMKKTFQGMNKQIDDFLGQQGVPKDMDYIE